MNTDFSRAANHRLTSSAERCAIGGTTAMKKYNVGIIGYGWAATGHIPAINAGPQAQVTAICSSRKLNSEELSAKHGGSISVYNTLDDLLADPSIDVVSICSYPPDHSRQ